MKAFAPIIPRNNTGNYIFFNRVSKYVVRELPNTAPGTIGEKQMFTCKKCGDEMEDEYMDYDGLCYGCTESMNEQEGLGDCWD